MNRTIKRNEGNHRGFKNLTRKPNYSLKYLGRGNINVFHSSLLIMPFLNHLSPTGGNLAILGMKSSERVNYKKPYRRDLTIERQSKSTGYFYIMAIEIIKEFSPSNFINKTSCFRFLNKPF